MKTKTGIITLAVVGSMLFLGGCASIESRSGSTVTVEYQCPICNSGFFSEAEWEEHVKRHHPSTVMAPVKASGLDERLPVVQYECPVCDTGFFSETEWQEHVKLNHAGKKAHVPKVRIKKELKTDQSTYIWYACPVCDSGFMSEAEWQEHAKRNHGK